MNTYMELPYIGADDFESDFVSAFGYMNFEIADINSFVLARQYRDNCNDECACDRDYYNPAFLMCSGKFCENIDSDNSVFKDCVQVFSTLESVEQKIAEIKKINLHNNNDLIIYQITHDESVLFKAFKVIPYSPH